MRRRVVRRQAGRAVVARAYERSSRSRVRARVPQRLAGGRVKSIERSASRLPRSSGSRRVSGRVAARRCSSRAPVSGRNSLRSGSGVVISRSRSWPSPAHLALTAPSRAATSACNAWRSPPARGVAGRSWASTLRAARTASSASLLPPERRSRRTRPTSSTRSPRSLKKRVRPAPNEPLPSISKRAPTRSVRVDQPQRLCVAVTVRGRRRLEDDRAAEDVHDRECMKVAVRIDTDDVVQLICEHPYRPPARALGGQIRCRSGVENRARHDCDGSRPTRRTGF